MYVYLTPLKTHGVLIRLFLLLDHIIPDQNLLQVVYKSIVNDTEQLQQTFESHGSVNTVVLQPPPDYKITLQYLVCPLTVSTHMQHSAFALSELILRFWRMEFFPFPLVPLR